MGRIVITTNVTLDGVVEDPDGQEGFRLGGWFAQPGSSDFEEWAKVATEEAMGAAAVLLGRRSDEWFATRWLSRSGTLADKLNSLRKYVVSSTLEHARWSNATVLTGDTMKELTELKQTVDGEILVYASYQLVRTLIDQDLADELRLVVFPVLLGTGVRLFDETSDQKPLRLIATRKIGDGLVFYAYEFVRAA